MKNQNNMEEKKECNGNCGMNYFDDNGCIERKRELVDPIPLHINATEEFKKNKKGMNALIEMVKLAYKNL